MTRPARQRPPLDAAALDRLALRYVERYATTRARLAAYLARKLAERGWAGERPADPARVAERMAELGYVDDRGFAATRAAAMARRGLGERRVTQALRHAGIAEEDRAALAPDIAANDVASAVAFARRKRIGPFAAEPADHPGQQRALAAMVRAGHGFALARRMVSLAPGQDIDAAFEEFVD